MMGTRSNSMWNARATSAVLHQPLTLPRFTKSLTVNPQIERNSPSAKSCEIGPLRIVESWEKGEKGSPIPILKKPYPYREGLQSIIAEVGKVVPSAVSLRYEDVADPSLIEKLDKSGYIDGLYR